MQGIQQLLIKPAHGLLIGLSLKCFKANLNNTQQQSRQIKVNRMDWNTVDLLFVVGLLYV